MVGIESLIIPRGFDAKKEEAEGAFNLYTAVVPRQEQKQFPIDGLLLREKKEKRGRTDGA